MKKIDLHIHSTHSDGKLSPKEIVDLATEREIPAISITDHDNAKANIEAQEYSKDKPIKYIPGIEITCTPPEGVKEVHMVGLFINSQDEEIQKIPQISRDNTEKVVKKIIKNLSSLGYEITFEELWRETEGKHLGRPWIAKILMRKYPKEFEDRKDVFNKLLGKQGKAFERPKGIPMEEAIRIIHNAGGIAILAHPFYLGEKTEETIENFVKLRGDGIEKDHIKKESIPDNMVSRLNQLAKKHNLIISGGTDFHEFKKDGKEIGDIGINKEELQKMEEFISKDNF